jgi:hypothetical protein
VHQPTANRLIAELSWRANVHPGIEFNVVDKFSVTLLRIARINLVAYLKDV